MQTILSSRWVEAYGRSLNLDASITGFAVTPDGESVLVAITVVDTVNVGHSALFRARLGTTDSPELVTEQLPRMSDAVIGFFLHVPFPSAEVFRILPWREEILRGLLLLSVEAGEA